MPEPPDPSVAAPSPAGGQQTEVLAIVGIIAAVLFWPAGLVVNAIALARIRRKRIGGRALAIIGLVFSLLAAVLTIVIVIVSIVAASAIRALPSKHPLPTVPPTEELHNYAPVTATGSVGELIPSGSGRAYMVRDLECNIAALDEDVTKQVPRGQYCRIGVTFANISTDEIEVTPGDAVAFIGTTGYVANGNAEVTGWTDPAPIPDEYAIDLQPGIEIELDLFFDVPAGSTPDSVEFLYYGDMATGAVAVNF